MKITTVFEFVVIFGALFYIMGAYSVELNNQYSDNPINTTKWEGKYDYSDSINTSMGKLIDKINTITDTEKSWFTRLSAGIVAIPYFVILFPIVALEGFATFVKILTGAGADIAVPQKILAAAVILVTIFLIKKLLEFFQRSQA